MLTVLTFLPLAGTAALFMLRADDHVWIRRIALIVSLVEFALSLLLLRGFELDSAQYQFVEFHSWIPSPPIHYHLGIDGISLFLVLLTTFLTPIAMLTAWKSIEQRVRGFFIALLVLETGVIGVFVSLDLFLFFLFWEAMLIPMYLLIGVWGGPKRVYAAIKFFLFTMAGSVLMLLAIFALYFQFYKTTGTYTFDVLQLYNAHIPVSTQYWLFAAFALSFAIKVPMFPVHTWLPDAHTEAPTAGSVILAGVLLKMGTYGFLRFAIPLFPAAAHAAIPIISILALVGIIYGAIVSMMQPDLKRLIAFSSVSHLGYVMLGMFAFNMQGLEGSIYQMLNHGVSTGGLFLIVGMLYERRHTRMISDFGGLSTPMPILAIFFMIVTLSSVALPGTNGFVGEFLILLGAFRANMLFGILGTTGVVLGAVYMFWMFQRVMFGEVKKEENRKLIDLGKREVLILCSIVFFIVLMGVYPKIFFKKMDTSVEGFLKFVKERNAYYVASEGAPVKVVLDTLKKPAE